MLGVQALCAYHAAAACWHQGMNHSYPRGSGLRQFSAAASAARTFDTLLKALERRQAKPLSVPVGRPAPRAWPEPDLSAEVAGWKSLPPRRAGGGGQRSGAAGRLDAGGAGRGGCHAGAQPGRGRE